MRILTVMSGVVLSATGAWCLAYYRSAFSSIAFVLGLAMIVSAIFLIAAYLVSGRKRLPETVLVEGIMTLIFGFVILNNEVTDTVLAMFFGSWLAVAGIIRFSQSLAVSRFDPKNWPKVLPMGLLNGTVGFIMLMHSLVSESNQLALVGAAFIMNGLSQLIYAMYMVKHEDHPKAAQAKERVEAKQAIAEAKRKERDELRSLGRKEREARKKELRELSKAEADAKKREAKQQKAREMEKRDSLLEQTIQLSEQETRQIAQMAGALAVHEPQEAPAPNEQEETAHYVVVPENKFTQEDALLEQFDSEPQLAGEVIPEQEQAASIMEEYEIQTPAGKDERFFETEAKPDLKEEKEEIVISWETLRKEPAWEKPDITEVLKSEIKTPEPLPLKPLTLEELIEENTVEAPEEEPKKEDELEKRFTEEFSWHWPPKGE